MAVTAMLPARVLSQAGFLPAPQVIVESGVSIPLRSGITVSAEIYRPVAPGRYPTLYAAGPLPLSGSGDRGIPVTAYTGPIDWFVSQGFNYVLVNSRGTGLSEGKFGFLSREEQQDHYEIIEWIAEQEWSDTQVAGIGAAYYGTSQWAMAAQSPPHLSCIAPVNGVTRPYQDWAFPGGVANEEFFYEWYEQSIRLANARANPDAPVVIDFDMDLQKLLHPGFDDFWRQRTLDLQLDYIEIPVFIISNWNHGWPSTSGSLEAHQHLSNSSKLLMLPLAPAEPPLLDMDFLAGELLPFYQWCLQDSSDSRYIEKPAVRYAVEGISGYRNENAWPPGNLLASELFFMAGSLVTASGSPGINLDLGSIQPGIFETAALDSGFEITGSAELFFSVNGSFVPGTELVVEAELRQLNASMQSSNTLPDYLLPGVQPDTTPISETQLLSRGKLLVDLQASSPATRQLMLQLNPVAKRVDQHQRLQLLVSARLSTPAGYPEFQTPGGVNGELRLLRLAVPSTRPISFTNEPAPRQSAAGNNRAESEPAGGQELPVIRLDEVLDY